MPTDQLLTIQRCNIVLGVAGTAVGGMIWGPRGLLAAGIGAALSVANFWAIRRLGLRAVAKVTDGDSARALPLVAALVGKMALLFGLVWFLVRRMGLPVLPFTMGLSIFVLSILITGLFLDRPGSKLPISSEDQG